jgi:hypothetical protein
VRERENDGKEEEWCSKDRRFIGGIVVGKRR